MVSKRAITWRYPFDVKKKKGVFGLKTVTVKNCKWARTELIVLSLVKESCRELATEFGVFRISGFRCSCKGVVVSLCSRPPYGSFWEALPFCPCACAALLNFFGICSGLFLKFAQRFQTSFFWRQEQKRGARFKSHFWIQTENPFFKTDTVETLSIWKKGCSV